MNGTATVARYKASAPMNTKSGASRVLLYVFNIWEGYEVWDYTQ
jgi:hypothetical protein